MYYSTKEMKKKKKKKLKACLPPCRPMKISPCYGKPTINFPWPDCEIISLFYFQICPWRNQIVRFTKSIFL